MFRLKNLRKDLIDKELSRQSEIFNVKFTQFKPSKIWIKKLFQRYKVKECVECFYDSEPDYESEEIYNMYMDYNYRRKMIE